MMQKWCLPMKTTSIGLVAMRLLARSALFLMIWPSLADAGCQPLLLDKDAIKRLRASVSVTIKKGDVAPWLSTESQVSGWCFFGAANVALSDGVFWAVNGIARSWAGRDRISCDGRTYALVDGWTSMPNRTEFSAALNDKINQACP